MNIIEKMAQNIIKGENIGDINLFVSQAKPIELLALSCFPGVGNASDEIDSDYSHYTVSTDILSLVGEELNNEAWMEENINTTHDLINEAIKKIGGKYNLIDGDAL
jgi:hypothetical protein